MSDFHYTGQAVPCNSSSITEAILHEVSPRRTGQLICYHTDYIKE